MLRRTPLARGSKPMRSTTPLKRTPMARGTSTLTTRKPMARMSAIKPKARKSHTVAESTYLGAVAERGCRLCRFLGLGATPAIVHHQRTGQGRMRASHYRTCGLCPHHHQDSGEGVHDMGRDEFADYYGISEVALVELTRDELRHLIPEGC